MNLPSAILLLLLVLLPTAAAPAQSTFSQDSAFAFLRTLSVDIGPRPMGSPAEHRAIQFAVEKFREFGCQQSYVMPMTVAEGVNTNSGVAIGVLKGKTDRIIIVGGHIDSAGPDIPGANDDGSGAACVLELARILGKDQHESTIMFCCWGGEEQGLEGSKYFVEHFDRLDSVVLMLQLDMTDGGSTLEIDPDYNGISAPRWLTETAFEIFFHELHYKGLIYPTASATLNGASGGSTGSDHDSFLDKGIPAIDFTSDVDYPIHTPLDNLANFTPSGLKRTGDLVLKLVERFDAGVPSRTTEHYMLVQLGSTPVFFPLWLLWLVIAAAVLLALYAVIMLRRRRVIPEGVTKVRWSFIKLILFALIIQSFIWLSETLMDILSGYRFPWVNHFSGFVVLGILFGIIGLWFVLRVERRFSLTSDAYLFGWRSLVILVVLTILAALRSPEFAAFPALATVFMSLAILLRSSFVRVAFWLLSGLIVLRLIFFEELGLIQRILTQNTIHTFSGLVIYEVVFIVAFALFSLPFVFGFAAVYRDSGRDLLWLKKFRERKGLAVVSVAALSVMLYLFVQHPYDQKWHSRIQVEQKYTVGSDSSTITIGGSEYFKGVIMVAANKEVALEKRRNFFELQPSQSSVVTWCSMDVNSSPARKTNVQDSVWKLDRQLTIHSTMRPFRINLRYTSSLPFEVSSPWAYRRADRFAKASDRLRTFSWYSFPDTLISIPITFTLRDTQRVSEKIEVIYDTLAYPVHLQKELTYVEARTWVTDSHEFCVCDDSTSIAARRK